MKNLSQSLVLFGSVSLAASSSYNTSLPGVTWDNDAWTLICTTANNSDWYSQSFVSNGYIGASFASTGPFPYTYPPSSVTGGPYFNEHVTFGTVAGFFDRQPKTSFADAPWLWQYGWESAIAGIPSWAAIVVDLGNGVYLDSSVPESHLSNVVLKQNYKHGYAQYSYTWMPPSGTHFDVSYLVFADKGYPNRAHVQLTLSASSATEVTIVNLIDGSTALRSDPAGSGNDGRYMYSAVQPSGVSNVTAWIYSTIDGPGVNETTLDELSGQPYINNNPSTIAQGATISLVPGQPVNITKYVGIASTDSFPYPLAQALNASINALATGFESAFEDHVQEWDTVLPRTAVTSFADPATGIIPDTLVERQIATVVAASVLLQGTVSASAVAQVDSAPIDIYGLSVCGLLSDCYGGQRYWDQDIWMGPYMFATNPAAAKQITQSRVAFYTQSKTNIQTAFEGSKGDVSFSPGAAVYAWSTGRDGNCTGFAPCWDYEYHINGDIVKGFVDYWAASGDAVFFEQYLLPITNSISTFYSDLLAPDSSSGTWTITNMTDPDEDAQYVNNGAYTMSIIKYTLQAANYFNKMFHQSQNATWEVQAAAVAIPMDSETGLILEYTDMPDSIAIKQADVVMLTYPLNNANNASLASQQENLAFYASKQNLGGPGMTWSIYSIDSSALMTSGCAAYTYDLYAWTPYRRAPWFTFSEQMNPNDGGAYPFFTGLGGFLQIDLMGYLGLRFGPALELQIYPNLPPQIPYMRYPTFHWQGWPIAAEANQTHTTLRRTGDALSTANQAFARAGIPVRVGRDATDTVATFDLEQNGVLVLENINSASNMTLANNILQCRPVVSSSEMATAPGQFPQAAVDGAESTIWLPTAGSGISSMTVSLEGTSYTSVDSVVVQWTDGAASNTSVIFHNGTDVSSGIVVVLGNSTSGNMTTVNVTGKGIWTGKYATLYTTGQTGQGRQVGVAEWAVIVS